MSYKEARCDEFVNEVRRIPGSYYPEFNDVGELLIQPDTPPGFAKDFDAHVRATCAWMIEKHDSDSAKTKLWDEADATIQTLVPKPGSVFDQTMIDWAIKRIA